MSFRKLHRKRSTFACVETHFVYLEPLNDRTQALIAFVSSVEASSSSNVRVSSETRMPRGFRICEEIVDVLTEKAWSTHFPESLLG